MGDAVLVHGATHYTCPLLAGVTASLVAGAVLVGLGAPISTAATPAPTVIRLVSVTVGSSARATPALPGVPGKETPYVKETVRDRLYNGVRQFGRARLALVGTDTETVLRFRSGREWIGANARLPGGTIYVRGYARRAGGGVTDTVTGGTGRYAGARGTLTILDLPNYRGLAANIYRLTR